MNGSFVRTQTALHNVTPLALDEALEIMRQLNAELPGYLVPKLVKEYPGEASKTLINHP